MSHQMSTISLISSSKCNLQCSFCYLHKIKACSKFDDIIVKAFQDGSYIENVHKSLEALDVDPKYIKHLSIWGAETSLGLKYLTPNIEKLYNYYPNIESNLLITNWTTDPDQFVAYYKELDRCAKVPQKHVLQVSIDGPEGRVMKEGHNASWEVYMKNFKRFGEKMYEVDFKNTKGIDIKFNSVIKKETYLDIFSDEDKAYEYLKFMEDKAIELRQMLGKFLWVRLSFPGVALPFNSTIEEGKKFLDCFKVTEKVLQEKFAGSDVYKDTRAFRGWYYNIARSTQYLEKEKSCSSMLGSAVFLPDGTIVECNASYIEKFPEYQEEMLKDKNMYEYYLAKLRSPNFYNPSQMTEEEIERMFEIVQYGYRSTTNVYTNMKLAMMKELALSNQIPSDLAHDTQKCLKLIKWMDGYHSCSRENVAQTGIPYLTGPDQYRRLHNGLSQYLYDLEKDKVCQIKK